MRIDTSRPLRVKAVCVFDVFCVGQVESSASWQAADPLLGQCLELIVTVRMTPIYTFFKTCFVDSEVFIAVEKAIMSYYDLSYRYKYEVPQIWIFWTDISTVQHPFNAALSQLRVPVMDLFDLTLQTEGHREVGFLRWWQMMGNVIFQRS